MPHVYENTWREKEGFELWSHLLPWQTTPLVPCPSQPLRRLVLHFLIDLQFYDYLMGISFSSDRDKSSSSEDNESEPLQVLPPPGVFLYEFDPSQIYTPYMPTEGMTLDTSRLPDSKPITRNQRKPRLSALKLKKVPRPAITKNATSKTNRKCPPMPSTIEAILRLIDEIKEKKTLTEEDKLQQNRLNRKLGKLRRKERDPADYYRKRKEEKQRARERQFEMKRLSQEPSL